mmetsp:Transcript_2368/g.8879  ORF Transcript_2368/g.8879 Transcript_2368/m.8879 type:complete len:97 (+) Transcript_2368:4555-4845(+)
MSSDGVSSLPGANSNSPSEPLRYFVPLIKLERYPDPFNVMPMLCDTPLAPSCVPLGEKDTFDEALSQNLTINKTMTTDNRRIEMRGWVIYGTKGEM